MKTETSFAPLLMIKSGITNIDFYKKAFGAVETFRFTNDDGGIHVVELSIDGQIFHLHEENHAKGNFSPAASNGRAITIGLFVDDVHTVQAQALAAGAIEISPVTDYDYGYRQGDIEDPFGHRWTIQKKT
jgi:PhnB protein